MTPMLVSRCHHCGSQNFEVMWSSVTLRREYGNLQTHCFDCGKYKTVHVHQFKPGKFRILAKKVARRAA